VPLAGTSVGCGVVAHSSVQATADQLAILRRRPGPGIGESLPASFLKHADEQTVAGLAAVLQAIHGSELREASFGDWGVVTAACFLGRSLLAAALQRFSIEGAWGMSPHFIPHHSGHSPSGTISQVLKAHGPNFGAGGGPSGALDALIAGAVLIEGNTVPGVWVVLSGYDPEPIPQGDGSCSSALECRAVALALSAAHPSWQGLHLRIVPERWHDLTRPAAGEPARKWVGNLDTFLTALTKAEGPAATLVWQIEGVGRLEIMRDAPVARIQTNGAVAPSKGAHARADQPAGVGTEQKW
jgi:hypothetical protein